MQVYQSLRRSTTPTKGDMVLDIHRLRRWLWIIPRRILQRLAADINVVVATFALPRTGCVIRRIRESLHFIDNGRCWEIDIAFHRFEMISFCYDGTIGSSRLCVHCGEFKVVEMRWEIELSSCRNVTSWENDLVE